MDALYRGEELEHDTAQDMASELNEWFSVEGDIDDFIYYWETRGYCAALFCVDGCVVTVFWLLCLLGIE